jgi:hypothetical protein
MQSLAGHRSPVADRRSTAGSRPPSRGPRTASLYEFHGVTIDSAMPLPELRRTRAKADGDSIEIRVVDTPFNGPAEWFQRWSVPRGPALRRRPWLSFGRQENGYLLRFHDLADFRVSLGGARVECLQIDCCPDVTLRHLLLDQVLPLVLSQRGRLVLHASAVHVNGFGAVAFAGRAGSGKSTLAAAIARRAGRAIVSDDCLVAQAGSLQPAVIPGYPGLRLWPDAVRSLRFAAASTHDVAHYTAKQRVVGRLEFRDRTTPLRRIFVLGRRTSAGSPTAQPLRARDALVALSEYAYLMDVRDKRQLTTVFQQLSALVERVPVARLSVNGGWSTLGRTADRVVALAAADS